MFKIIISKIDFKTQCSYICLAKVSFYNHFGEHIHEETSINIIAT